MTRRLRQNNKWMRKLRKQCEHSHWQAQNGMTMPKKGFEEDYTKQYSWKINYHILFALFDDFGDA